MANRKSNRKPSHVSSRNVIDDLGFSPEEAASVKLKVQLHTEIMKVIKRKKFTSRQLEKLLDIPQPRVSELLNGKIFERMTSDRLATYLHRLGRTVEIRSKPRKVQPPEAAQHWTAYFSTLKTIYGGGAKSQIYGPKVSDYETPRIILVWDDAGDCDTLQGV